MDYKNTYPYSSTRKDNDYSEYYKKYDYGKDEKDEKDEYKQDTENENIIDEKIISSAIDRPDNDNFEKDKTKSLTDINKKQELLIKYKQELQGKIDGFNEQMSSLLELKECHKQPFNLNEIRLERIENNEGKDKNSEDMRNSGISKLKDEIKNLESLIDKSNIGESVIDQEKYDENCKLDNYTLFRTNRFYDNDYFRTWVQEFQRTYRSRRPALVDPLVARFVASTSDEWRAGGSKYGGRPPILKGNLTRDRAIYLAMELWPKYLNDLNIISDIDRHLDTYRYKLAMTTNKLKIKREELSRKSADKSDNLYKIENSITEEVIKEEKNILPITKPLNNNFIPQYFSCLKCGSEECKEKDRIMAIYQFDENNNIIDENFKNYIIENKIDLEQGDVVAAEGDTYQGIISHKDVQFITSNYDECYTNYKLKEINEDEEDDDDRIVDFNSETQFIDIYKYIGSNQKYKIPEDNEDSHYLDTHRRAGSGDDYMNRLKKYIKYDTKPKIEDNLRDFCVYAGKENNDDANDEYKKIFRCGCANHSTNNYDNFGIKVETKSNCENFKLIERINNYSYKFIPIEDNEYEPKTIFYCMSCKKFFRYNCLRDINQDKNTGKVIPTTDYSTCNKITNLSETLSVINKNILFRTSLFSESYSKHLETTARDLKLTIINKFLGNNKVQTTATGLLGNIVGNAKEVGFDFSKDGLGDSIKRIGSSLIESKFKQKGGINLDSITKNIKNVGINIGNNNYGKLNLKDKYEDFTKELDKWKVHPQEDNYLIKLKGISSSIVKVDENDKKPIRGKFVIIQEEYISDFENKFSTIKNYYPFLKEDFNTLEGLKISGDDIYTQKKINIWGKEFSIMDELNKRLSSTGINNDNKLQDNYIQLDDRLSRKVRSFRNDYSNSLGINKEILKLMGNFTFSKEIITAYDNNLGGVNLLYFKLIKNRPAFESTEYKFLEKYGNFKYIEPRLYTNTDRTKRNINSILDIHETIVEYIEREGEDGAINLNTTRPEVEAMNRLRERAPDTPGGGRLRDMNYSRAVRYYNDKLPYFEYTLSPEKIISQMGQPASGVWSKKLHNCLKEFEKLSLSFEKESDIDDLNKKISPLDFSSESKGFRQFSTIKETLNNNLTFKKGIEELNNLYKKKKEGLDKELKSSLNFKGKALDINNPVYESLVSEMCGGNSGIFWYGNNSEKYKKYYNLENYQIARSIHSKFGVVYLPWYETGFNYYDFNLTNDLDLTTNEEALKNIKGRIQKFNVKLEEKKQLLKDNPFPVRDRPATRRINELNKNIMDERVELESIIEKLKTSKSEILMMDIQNLKGLKDNQLICSASGEENTSENLTPSRAGGVQFAESDTVAGDGGEIYRAPRRARIGSVPDISTLTTRNIPVIENDNKSSILKGDEILSKLQKFKSPNVWDIYRKEVLSLFPLLYDGNTIYQSINDGKNPCFITGHFKITQLKTQDNILKGCHSLNNNNFENKDIPTIWVEPRNQSGNKIKPPIEIIRLKQNIKDSCAKYYSVKLSLENDKNALKQYEKDNNKYLKDLKKKEKEDKEREKKEKEDREKEDREKEQIYQGDQEQGLKTREELGDSDKEEQNINQSEKEISEKEISKDIDKEDINNKLYNKEDFTNLNNELNNLKREAKRKEEILKNISKNIKFLKSRRHGEDSEQRQIQQRDYELKQKELILFQKLIEQREEKLKLMKLLINKITEKDENQLSSLLKKNEIEKQKNYLALENELNNITGNHIDDLDQYKNNAQGNEISELKNQLNNLESNEINTQRDLVQSGGGRNKNDLSELLYKTVTKGNRTKKKNNIRKKEKSLRKKTKNI